jgi:hypothetical protein
VTYAYVDFVLRVTFAYVAFVLCLTCTTDVNM